MHIIHSIAMEYKSLFNSTYLKCHKQVLLQFSVCQIVKAHGPRKMGFIEQVKVPYGCHAKDESTCGARGRERAKFAMWWNLMGVHYES
jgi:hypothetical protein